MTITVLPTTRVHRAGNAFGRLAIVAGLLVLAATVGYLTWTGHVGNRQAAGTVAALQKQWQDDPGTPVAPSNGVTGHAGQGSSGSAGSTAVEEEITPVLGKAFAVMTVPRFGKKWEMPVFEGTGQDVLRGGVGHYPSTALPGEIGNFAVAGHRTTWAHPFKNVEDLRTGDAVIVQTRYARYTYRVTSHRVVRPDDSDVLDPVPSDPGAVPDQAQLTLTTCHPEYSAWRRWVVRAQLVDVTST